MSTSKRISVVVWIILPSLFLLSGSDKSLAKKGKGGGDGGQNLAIHGCITFRDQEAVPRDRIRSDGWGAYCDATDSLIGLLNFFQFNVEIANGRSLSLEFDGMVHDPNDIPIQEFWTFSIPATLDEMRAQAIGIPVKRDLRLRFGKQKDVVLVLFGGFGFGDQATVTRTAQDKWTIEVFPGDNAVLVRQGKGNANFIQLGSGSMPFKLIYDGTQ